LAVVEFSPLARQAIRLAPIKEVADHVLVAPLAVLAAADFMAAVVAVAAVFQQQTL